MTNNKQQTAMQMAIAHYKKLSEEGSNQAYVVAKFLEETFLEIEKEQHRVTAEDFYYGNWEYKKFHDYFNETYGGGEK